MVQYLYMMFDVTGEVVVQEIGIHIDKCGHTAVQLYSCRSAADGKAGIKSYHWTIDRQRQEKANSSAVLHLPLACCVAVSPGARVVADGTAVYRKTHGCL